MVQQQVTKVVVDQHHRQTEANKDQTALQEALVEDLAVRMVALGITVLVAVDLRIVPLEVDRVKLNEATESIDILKDRKFQ